MDQWCCESCDLLIGQHRCQVWLKCECGPRVLAAKVSADTAHATQEDQVIRSEVIWNC